MNEFKTANYTANTFMSDYVLRKYSKNINKAIGSLLIFPKDYKLKSNLEKRWRVYFYYNLNGKQKRFEAASHVDNGQTIQINRFKDHSLKVEAVEDLRDYIAHLLRTEPKFILKLLYGIEKAKELYPSVYLIEEEKVQHDLSIEKAFDDALEAKKANVSNTHYLGLKSVKNKFLAHIGKNKGDTVDLLNKKMLVGFIDAASIGKSNQTRNNMKSMLSALLAKMKEQDVIQVNHIEGLRNLKSKPKVHKPYTNEQRLEIFKHLKEKDFLMYAYCLHIYYGLMRPQTIVRLKVKHIDLVNGLFKTDTKTGDFLKTIVKPLIDECYSKLDLENADPEHFMFGRNGFMAQWQSNDENRRGAFTKRFKPYKTELKLDKDHDLYSLRHSAIGNLFDNKCKELEEEGVPDYKNRAIDFIMPLTNHKSREQTKQYLRGISTSLHIDWSEYL